MPYPMPSRLGWLPRRRDLQVVFTDRPTTTGRGLVPHPWETGDHPSTRVDYR
jgi:hypothetical protein